MDLNSTQKGNCLKNVFLYGDYHVIFVPLCVLSRRHHDNKEKQTEKCLRARPKHRSTFFSSHLAGAFIPWEG